MGPRSRHRPWHGSAPLYQYGKSFGVFHALYTRGLEVRPGLERIVDRLLRGTSSGGYRVYACSIRATRIGGVWLELCVRSGGGVARIVDVTLFPGRGVYRGWVELHNVSARAPVALYGSWVEDWLLGVMSPLLGPGEKLFYEYTGDRETMVQLERGYPVLASRLGYRLFKAGFTWLKDMYFPEGFREGGAKLLAEKPLASRRASHLAEHRASLIGFLAGCGRIRDHYHYRACNRARLALRDLESVLAGI